MNNEPEKPPQNITQDPGLAPNPTHPVCPYCLKDPALISTVGPIAIASLQVAVIFCGNVQCRKIFNVLLVGMAQPTIAPGRLIHPS